MRVPHYEKEEELGNRKYILLLLGTHLQRIVGAEQALTKSNVGYVIDPREARPTKGSELSTSISQ